MARQILIRRGLSTLWTSVNPLLASGEMGLETDTNLFKFGTGLANWVDLPYSNIKDHIASAISSVASGNLVSTNVQDALNELQSDIDTRALNSDLSNHLSDTIDAHDASAISTIAFGNLVATDVQTALNELQSDIDTRALNSDLSNHITDTTDAHAASAISNIPTGNLAAITAQAALNELQTDIDTINLIKGTACFSGCVTEPSYVDNTGGNVTINTVDVNLFDNANFSGITTKHTLAAITVDLVDGVRNYIVADHNAGSPILRLTTDVNEINESNITPVYTILRVGTYLNFLGWDTLGRGLANKLHQATVKTDRYKFENKWTISEYGTRNLNIGGNNIYIGANKIVAQAIATSTDNIRYFERTSPSTWTFSLVTQYNNTQYFNGTTTATLTNNKYAVNWLYRGAEITNHLYMVLGEGDYSLQEAQSSQPPSSLPVTITGHAFLIGRVIVQKNAATASQINTVSEESFTPSATTIHNDLSELQGGTTAEYYHLTSAQASSLNGTQNYVTKYGATGLAASNIFDNGTSVGIGTTGPLDKLHVNSSTGVDTQFRFSQTGTDTSWSGGAYSDNSFRINETNVASRVVIASGGNVGIDRPSPTYKLDVNGTARIGGATDFTSIEADGTIVMNGAATVYNDLITSATNLRGGATPPTFAIFTNGIYSNLFANATSDELHGSFETQHDYKEGSNVEVHLHWSPNDTAAGNTYWAFEYTKANMTTGTFGASTTINGTFAAGGTALKHNYGSFGTISGTGMKIGDIIMFRIVRIGGNALDTYTGGAFLLSIGIHYECDTLGSRTTTEK